MRDRVVQYPNRFKITRSDGSTEVVTLEAMPGIITEAGTPINKANLLSDETAEIYALTGNDATVNNALANVSGVCQPSRKLYGNVTFADSIASGGTLTKTIAIGENKKFGVCVMRTTSAIHTSSGNDAYSIIVFFCRDNLRTKAAGVDSGGNWSFGGAIARRHYGAVTAADVETVRGFGVHVAGWRVQITDICIDDTNIVIDFKSHNDDSTNLTCTVDWEVW